jgi:hypothetical protein
VNWLTSRRSLNSKLRTLIRIPVLVIVIYLIIVAVGSLFGLAMASWPLLTFFVSLILASVVELLLARAPSDSGSGTSS